MIAHLWQSTLFAAVVGLLALALRNNRAQIRYWLWFSASIKFLIPFAILTVLGSRAPVKITAPTAVVVAVIEMSEPTIISGSSIEVTPPSRDWLPSALFGIWAVGFSTVALIRLRDLLRIRRAVRASTPIHIAAWVDIRSTPGLLEPGVVGLGFSRWSRPILLLPEGIADRLTPAQLEAVLAHELCHVRRRDNLFSAIHMLVEAIFWFHPLIWWIGARLVEERELACDEEVLRQGSEPRVYAEGILNVCKLYVESPLACVAGVTGSDLKRRIHAIMTGRIANDLTLSRKIALIAAGAAALALPTAVGILRAQSTTTPTPKFEVASVRMVPHIDGPNTVVMGMGGPGTDDPTQVTYTYAPLSGIIADAYGINGAGRVFGPDWLTSQRYNIVAKIPEGATRQQLHLMMQNLLAERFQLTFHRETRQYESYDLVVAKNGPKLKPAKETPSLSAGIPSETISANGNVPLDKNGFPLLPEGPSRATAFVDGQFRTAAHSQTISAIVNLLSNRVGGTVKDKTGLQGKYDFTLECVPADPGPTIFAAVEEQLGLKLVPAKESADVLIIDHIEKTPTEN